MKLAVYGYTVIEALMFLAISAGLFVSVNALISGRQAETEFNTGVRDFENSLQDVMNDVATGFYNSFDDISCTGTPGNYTIGTGGVKGTNSNCTFVGKAIQFSPSFGTTPRGTVNVFTIIGQREINDAGTIREPKNIEEAGPGLPQSSDLLADSITLNSGMVIRDVQIGGVTGVGGIAVLDSFGQTNSTGGAVVSRSASNGLSRLPGLGLDAAYSDVQSSVNGIDGTSAIGETVLICVGDSGATGRRAAIELVGRGTNILFGTESIDAGCPA